MIQRVGISLDDYAYYFERLLEFGPEMESLYGQAVLQINHWKKRHQENDVYLGFEPNEDSLCFHDSRFGEPRKIVLSMLEGAAYLACDHVPTPLAKVIEDVASARNCSAAEVTQAVSRLDQERLVWREGQNVFGLGVPWAVVRQHVESRWPKEWTSVYY